MGRRNQPEAFGRERRQQSGVVLGARQRVGPAPRRLELQADQRFRLFHRGGDAVDDGNAEFLRQFCREIGHPGATEHDGFRALVERARNLGVEFCFRAGARLFEIEHRDIAGGDRRPFRKAIAPHQFFQRHDRARQGRDDRDAFCQLPRRHQRRLANPDHRKRCDRSRGIEPGVIETGDDAGVGVGCVQQCLDQAGNGKGFIIKSFDRDRPHR